MSNKTELNLSKNNKLNFLSGFFTEFYLNLHLKIPLENMLRLQEMASKQLYISKILRGGMPPDPPR